MKKILLTLLAILFAFVLIGQEAELSNYEKYRIEKDKELYGTPDTTKTDTVYIIVKEKSEPVIINNYYEDNDQPNYRVLLTFGYVYRPYCLHYDPFYYNYWYTPYYYNRYYNSYYYGYWGRNSYYINHYYGHRYVVSNHVNIKSKPTYTREYKPTYTVPRTSTRPTYNNDVTRSRNTTTRPTSNTQSRTYNTPTRTAPSTAPSYSRTAPTRAPSNTTSRSYSQPTRSAGSSTGTSGSRSAGGR